MMILWIVSSLFVIGYGQDVDFTIASCGSVGGSMTMTANYTGSGTVTAVQWYYSGKTGSNLVVRASTCTLFGNVPAGYPNSSRMSYECPATHSLALNTFKLIVTGLQEDELKNRWGATFTVSGSTPPDVSNTTVVICPKEEDTDQTPAIVGGVLGGLAFIGIGVAVGVILYKKKCTAKSDDNRDQKSPGKKVQPRSDSHDPEKGQPGKEKSTPKKNEKPDSGDHEKSVSKKDKTKSPRPQPAPPTSAEAASAASMHGREPNKRKKKCKRRLEESDSAVSRTDVELQDSSKLNKRPMPSIPQGHDSKGRGLSANFDDDHPMIGIDAPAKKAGALPSLHEGTGDQEPKQLKKKKKKKSEDNNDE